MTILAGIRQYLEQGNAKGVKSMVNLALREGMVPEDILEQGLIQGMSDFGQKFRRNEVFVPEVLIAARAMSAGVELLHEPLSANKKRAEGKVVLGTVAGDLHDIGKNLVKLMLTSHGIKVIDLGADVPTNTFISAVFQHCHDALALSALLTTTLKEMEKVVKALEDTGLRSQVKVMVGGAPVTEAYAKRIGADYYGKDAFVGAAYIMDLLSSRHESKKTAGNS
mgnify:CR=1 FL=1